MDDQGSEAEEPAGLTLRQSKTLAILLTVGVFVLLTIFGWNYWFNGQTPRLQENPQVVGTFQIDLNTADQVELELLPNIGPTLARQILSYRSLHGRFRNVQELKQVKGIGPKRLEKMRPFLLPIENDDKKQ